MPSQDFPRHPHDPSWTPGKVETDLELVTSRPRYLARKYYRIKKSLDAEEGKLGCLTSRRG